MILGILSHNSTCTRTEIIKSGNTAKRRHEKETNVTSRCTKWNTAINEKAYMCVHLEIREQPLGECNCWERKLLSYVHKGKGERKGTITWMSEVWKTLHQARGKVRVHKRDTKEQTRVLEWDNLEKEKKKPPRWYHNRIVTSVAFISAWLYILLGLLSA